MGVSSMFHVLNGRVWRTAVWIVRSQQLAATAGHVTLGVLSPKGVVGAAVRVDEVTLGECAE